MDSYMEKMVLRACNCDMGGLWRPGAVLETMQESMERVNRMFNLDLGVKLRRIQQPAAEEAVTDVK